MSKQTKPSFKSLSKTVEASLADLEKLQPTPAALTSRDQARIHLQQAARFLAVGATTEATADDE